MFGQYDYSGTTLRNSFTLHLIFFSSRNFYPKIHTGAQISTQRPVLKDSDMDSENLRSLIRLSVSDGQKTDSSKVILFIGI